MSTSILADLPTLRQILHRECEELIAELTAKPGYNVALIDQLTREKWRLAAADLADKEPMEVVG